MPFSNPSRWQQRILRSGRGILVVVVGLSACLIVAIWAVALARIQFEHDRLLASEVAKNDTLALAYKERTLRSIEIFDVVIRTLREDFLAGRVPRDLAPRLAASGLNPEYYTVISVIGPDGGVLATNARDLTQNFSDRSYFAEHAKDPTDRLILGQPIVGRVSQRPIMSLTRRIERPGGGFGGVIFVGLDAAFLAAPYEKGSIGANDVIAIIGLDGVIRARRQGEKLSFGEDARAARVFSDLRSADQGHYAAPAALDGVMRLTSFQRIPGYPLAVTSGSSAGDVLVAARGSDRITYAAAAIGTLLACVFGGTLSYAVLRNQAALEAVASSARLYRLVFENGFDAILHVRPNGDILAANATACQLFRASESRLRAIGWRPIVDARDHRAGPLLERHEVAARRQGQLSMIRGDGEQFEAELSVANFSDGDGKPAASVIVRDVDERHAADARRAEVELRRIESQKLESIGTLAGGIAHDFNNILAGILGNASMLRQDLQGADLGVDALERIQRAAMRGRSLIQQILTFSRQQPERQEPLALQPLLEETMALLRATLPSTVQLSVELQAAPMAVMANPTQLQQIVLNLCTNAWQALPQEKGRVQVELEAVAGTGAASAATRWARLRVRDDGAGMDENTKRRLFEPFFTTKPIGKGTGLGLAVVHGIVLAHGGHISVVSAPGAGTTFDVLLPLVQLPPDHAAAAAALHRERAGHGERVLYVDDDEVMTLTVESLLQRSGYEVTAYSSAKAALRDFEARPDAFDIVVTDYNMPEFSGLDLARAVRQLRPDMPVIVSSGYVSDELESRARQMGVDRILLKAYTFDSLAELVDESLSSRRTP